MLLKQTIYFGYNTTIGSIENVDGKRAIHFATAHDKRRDIGFLTFKEYAEIPKEEGEIHIYFNNENEAIELRINLENCITKFKKYGDRPVYKYHGIEFNFYNYNQKSYETLIHMLKILFSSKRRFISYCL